MTDKARKRIPICENRRARHEYEIIETVEAGMALLGSEVKSLRDGKGSIAEAYVRIEDGSAWLMEAHIAAYPQANRNNHEPKRERRLLLNASEVRRWQKRVSEKGLTVVPLRMYFEGPWAKVEIALARGKHTHDKRDSAREKDDKREMERAMRRRG